MSIDHNDLQSKGVDIAAAINEAFLNKFAASHHAANPTVYSGSQRFTQFDNDIEISFKANTPLSFDFSRQISNARFKRLWLQHLKIKGVSQSTQLSDLLTTPPNVSLGCKSVIFDIKIFDGKTNDVLLSVDFDWNLVALAAISLDEGKLSLEPIRIGFSQKISIIEEAILDRVRSNLSASGGNQKPSRPSTFGDPSDPVWCAKLEKMIILLLNQVLAVQIANFISEFELPRAIEVADGIAIEPGYLAIHGDNLVVGARITSQPIGIAALQSEISSLIAQFHERSEIEFGSLTDEELKLWSPDSSPTVSWLNETAKSYEEVARQEVSSSKEVSATRFDKNLQILFNDRPFDLLAKKFLSISEGDKGGVSLDRLLKAEAEWWLRVENAKASVVTGGVQLEADIAVGGGVKVCHFNIDPKKFGQWKCYGVGVELYPIPNFGVQAFPTFPSSGVFVNGRLLTTGIGVRFLGLPSWANDLISWISGFLTAPLLAIIRAAVARFRIRIMKYPKHFPGTGLEWTPNLNERLNNIGPYLLLSGDPDFE